MTQRMNRRLWYESELPNQGLPSLPSHFVRVNTLNGMKPLLHPLFPDTSELDVNPLDGEEDENYGVRVKDSGLSYLSWQFEHVYDFPGMTKQDRPPILRGLYAFEKDADIQECTEKLILLIKQMKQAGVSGVIVVPSHSQKEIFDLSKMLDGPSELEPPQVPQVEILRKKTGCGGYILDGLKMIWLFKFCGMVGGAAKRLNHNLSIPIDVGSFSIMIYHFIGVLESQYQDVKMKAKRVLAEAGPILELLAKDKQVENQEEVINRMVCSMDKILSSRMESKLRNKLIVIPSHAYSDLMDIAWQPWEPHAAVIPMSCLGLTAYSDGGFPQKRILKVCEKQGDQIEGQCSFAGALLTSTGHVVLHWRYRVPIDTKSSNVAELLGVIFSLMLAHFLGIPIAVRCDNVLAIRTLSAILEKRTLDLKISRNACEALPVLNTLLKTILASSVTRECRLEWVRGHSGIIPNDLSDFLADQAFITGDLIDLKNMDSAAKALASKLSSLKTN